MLVSKIRPFHILVDASSHMLVSKVRPFRILVGPASSHMLVSKIRPFCIIPLVVACFCLLLLAFGSAISQPLQKRKKFDTLLDLCVSSLRRGHANLLCIVPILPDDPRRGSTTTTTLLSAITVDAT